MEQLEDGEVKRLLHKGWMTHDAMWFQHCALECGMEKANIINRAAVRSMARIEAKRILKAFGLAGIESFDELKAFMEAAEQVVKAEFMKFTVEFPEENLMRVNMPRCFALDGMTRAGLAGQYQCGIFERFWGWLEALGIPYEASPRVEGCMMHLKGRCFRDIRLDFGKAAGAVA